MKEAFEHKNRYAELYADAQQLGLKVKVHPAGRVYSHINVKATPGNGRLRQGPPAYGQRSTVSRAAEKGSQWLWMRIKDCTWAQKSEPWALEITA